MHMHTYLIKYYVQKSCMINSNFRPYSLCYAVGYQSERHEHICDGVVGQNNKGVAIWESGAEFYSRRSRKGGKLMSTIFSLILYLCFQVNCVDYYSGGDKPYLISGADDRLIKIWDYQNKTCVATLGLYFLYPF